MDIDALLELHAAPPDTNPAPTYSGYELLEEEGEVEPEDVDELYW